MTSAPDEFDDGVLATLRELGGPALLGRLVPTFIDHGRAHLEKAAAAARGGDRQAVARAAHTLRSSAGQLGATALFAAATALEREAAGAGELGPLVAATTRAFERAAGHLSEALAGPGHG